MSTGLPDLNRRNFIKVTSIGAAAMLVGCSTHSPPKISSTGEKSENLGLFVRISKDNKITINTSNIFITFYDGYIDIRTISHSRNSIIIIV